MRKRLKKTLKGMMKMLRVKRVTLLIVDFSLLIIPFT